MTKPIYLRVPLSKEEHAQLRQRAAEDKRTLGQMAAVYIALALRDGIPTLEDLAPTKEEHPQLTPPTGTVGG